MGIRESALRKKNQFGINVTNDNGREEEVYITDNLNCAITISEKY